MRGEAHRLVPTAILTLDFANSDHIVGISNLPSLFLSDKMLGIASKSRDRAKIPPIDDGNTRSIGISRRLDTEESVVAPSDLHQALIHDGMLGMINICVD